MRAVTEASPPARRLTTPRWLDARVALGLLLVMASVVIGARVFAAAGRYSEVYVARRLLVPGAHLSAGDLTTGRVRFDGEGGRYLAAGSPPVGYLVTRPVAAGEFVPAGALTRSPAELTATRLVTVPVAAGHLPLDLGRGDEVDVYLTAKPMPGGSPSSRLLLSSALVDAISGAGAFSANDVSAVAMLVPAREVAGVVHAIEAGTIDLVRVPSSPVGPLTEGTPVTPGTR
jgi:hypothetical protein